MTYQGQYFTIISSISECDYKCETRNAEPEIGTDGSSQTRRNPRVDGYGSGFGPPRVCRSGFWTVLEPNRPVFAVQTRTTGGLPRPIANTTHYCKPINSNNLPRLVQLSNQTGLHFGVANKFVFHMSACKSKQHHINLIKHDSLTSNPCEAYVLIRAPRSVVKDEDLGISRCIREKSRALFCPV